MKDSKFKESIKIVERVYRYGRARQINPKDINYEIVFECLKDGDKYKQIYSEIEGNASESFGRYLQDIKQKYFPKPRPKTICEKYKDRIISDAKRREIMEMKKYKDYYFYIGAIATLLEEKKITKEEHIELSDTIQKNLKDK